MNIPFVVVEACWRKTVEVDAVVEDLEDGSGICRMSMGMDKRWQAKMEFMMGMY